MRYSSHAPTHTYSGTFLSLVQKMTLATVASWRWELLQQCKSFFFQGWEELDRGTLTWYCSLCVCSSSSTLLTAWVWLNSSCWVNSRHLITSCRPTLTLTVTQVNSILFLSCVKVIPASLLLLIRSPPLEPCWLEFPAQRHKHCWNSHGNLAAVSLRMCVYCAESLLQLLDMRLSVCGAAAQLFDDRGHLDLYQFVICIFQLLKSNRQTLTSRVQHCVWFKNQCLHTSINRHNLKKLAKIQFGKKKSVFAICKI